jgi:hypothetical protein
MVPEKHLQHKKSQVQEGYPCNEHIGGYCHVLSSRKQMGNGSIIPVLV